MIVEQALLALIEKHEGLRESCYVDSRGFLSIGYGCNLDAIGANARCAAIGLDYAALRTGRPISQAQARALMASAAQHAMETAAVILRGFIAMPECVQMAVTDMVYNLGAAGFLKFYRLRRALEAGSWQEAAEQMRSSAWYHQVGQRAEDDIALVLEARSVQPTATLTIASR